MSINFKILGGLFSFRYINDVEDMDLDDLQEIYNDLEGEYKEMKSELEKLKDVIDKRNPEGLREKKRKKNKTAKEILDNEDIPYEVRMKYIIDAYRKDQKKWGKLYEYTKHLEGEVIRLKEILIANGYADSGIVGDCEPAKVINELKEKIKELEANKVIPKDVTAALIRIKQLENQIETFPLKVYKSQSFRDIIKSQEIYIKELQMLLDKNGVEYHPKEAENQLEKNGVDKVVDEGVRYSINFRALPIFINSPRQSMCVNYFKSLTASWPQKKELVRIVYSMMCSEEVVLSTQLYRNFMASDSKDAADLTKRTKFAAFAPCAILSDGKAKADLTKRTKFAAFAPCAILSDGKARENVKKLTDLCYLDFDNIKEEQQLIDAMNILRNDKNVLLASRSVSNEGLHVLISYKLKDMEMPPERKSMTPDEMQEVYAIVYNYLADKYMEKLGLMPDYNAGHMEHLYIVSHDPELYYNPNAESLIIDIGALNNIEDVHNDWTELEPRIYRLGEIDFEAID